MGKFHPAKADPHRDPKMIKNPILTPTTKYGVVYAEPTMPVSGGRTGPGAVDNSQAQWGRFASDSSWLHLQKAEIIKDAHR